MSFCGEYGKIARYYDELIHKLDDLPLYLHYARECGSPILELGVGTGRLALELADKGFEVAGIDGSTEMLSIAQVKLEELPGARVKDMVSLIHGDLPSVLYDRSVIEQQFRLIIVPCLLFHEFLSADDRMKLLRGIHTCLEPGGVAVIDLFCTESLSPEEIGTMGCRDYSKECADNLECDIEKVSRDIVYHTGTGDVATIRLKLDAGRCHRSDSIISVIRRIYHDRRNKLKSLVYVFDEIEPDGSIVPSLVQFQHALLSKDDVEACLIDAGFTGIKVYGSSDFQEWTDTSPQMIFIARKGKQVVGR